MRVEKADVGLRCCSSKILWVVEEEEVGVGSDVSKYVHHFALVECHYPNCTHTRRKTPTAALPVRCGRKDTEYVDGFVIGLQELYWPRECRL